MLSFWSTPSDSNFEHSESAVWQGQSGQENLGPNFILKIEGIGTTESGEAVTKIILSTRQATFNVQRFEGGQDSVRIFRWLYVMRPALPLPSALRKVLSSEVMFDITSCGVASRQGISLEELAVLWLVFRRGKAGRITYKAATLHEQLE